MSRTAKVACVTGAGTAPELMAEAVLALDAIARLHGLEIDETHVTFGAVAVARGGHAVPALTRAAILAADAVLVAGAEEPALAEIMSELDLRAQVTRVRFGHRDDVAFVSPLAEGAEEWTIEAAFRIAESRTMRIAAVGDAPWNDLVDAVAAHHEHVHVEHLAPKLAISLAAFNARRFVVALLGPVRAEGPRRPRRPRVGGGDRGARSSARDGARRGARSSGGARAEHVRAGARRRVRARRERRRQPEQHAARRG